MAVVFFVLPSLDRKWTWPLWKGWIPAALLALAPVTEAFLRSAASPGPGGLGLGVDGVEMHTDDLKSSDKSSRLCDLRPESTMELTSSDPALVLLAVLVPRVPFPLSLLLFLGLAMREVSVPSRSPDNPLSESARSTKNCISFGASQ